MAILSTMLSKAIAKMVFKPMRIASVEAVGKSFRLLRIQGQGFRDITWVPGQKAQFFLGNLTKRAYTPIDFDPTEGAASFLIYLHGKGPGSAWAESVRVGDDCHVMRPQDSLDLSVSDVPAVFFGDETSLAAAQALHRCSSQHISSRYFLEVSSPAEAEEASRRLGLSNVSLFHRSMDGSHLIAIAAQMETNALNMQSPQWVFTGHAASIQTLRSRLSRSGITLSKGKTKAYWATGKTGLD